MSQTSEPQMSESPGAGLSPAAPVLDLGENPMAVLEAAAWALAAAVATLRDAVDAPLEEVLAADPQRTAVLESVGLVHRVEGRFISHSSLTPPDASTARSSVEARLSALRQAVAAVVGPQAAEAQTAERRAAGPQGGWAAQPDAVLLNQGRASAATGRALATKVVPKLAGLEERLAAGRGRILDVGTGVAAIARVLAEHFPAVHVTGIDVLDRVLNLARAELAAASAEVASRIVLRHQDVADVQEPAAYALVWLPAPFVAEEALDAALPRLAGALEPGGWLVIGTNPVPGDALRRSVGRWTAVRNGGNSYDTAAMIAALEPLGLAEVRTFPTVPGGPVLVAARRTPAVA